MLETPRTHVRQRSIGRYEAEKKEFEISAPLLEAPETSTVVVPSRQPSLATLTLMWIATVAVTSLCTFLLARRPSVAYGSLADGFDTELESAKSAIKVQKTQFEGSLDFKDGYGFIPPDSPSMEYVGSTPEVDAAWMSLTEDRYFLLTDEEARNAYGENPEPYWNVHHGGYVAGLDVMHTLHCLAQLRKSLYPKVYPLDPKHGVRHLEHCLDHLRQLAMCNSDLTPIPTQYFEGIRRNYINSSRLHTCRDFRPVREWVTERFNGSTAVKPRNKDGTPRAEFYAPWGP